MTKYNSTSNLAKPSDNTPASASKRGRKQAKWPAWSWVGTALLFLPIFALLWIAVTERSPTLGDVADTVLWIYIKNSLTLLVGVCTLAVLWGVPCAWLMARYQFAGRRFFRWALLLPLALPPYLVAYIYTQFFEYAGPVQGFLRQLFEWHSVNDYWFFDIRSMGGAMFVLSLVFAPYVYWLTYLHFSQQSQSLIHAARVLGMKEGSIFRRVILPLARPSIAIACTIVGMETLADFGTASYFSVWHLTTAIYDMWQGRYDLAGAAQVSSMLLIFVVALVVLERQSRAKSRHYTNRHQPLLSVPLSKSKSFLAFLWCSLYMVMAFFFPLGWLLYEAVIYFADTHWDIFGRLLYHTLVASLGASIIATLIALWLQIYARLSPRKGSIAARLGAVGYAIPGAVLAIGVLIITSKLDHGINHFIEWLGYDPIGLVFTGTLMAIVFAFVSRFSAVSIGSVESGLGKIPRNLDHIAFLHGYTPFQTARKVWIPLLRNSLLAAFLLVFLESIKELPAALLLRPFNVDLISTYVYQYMSAENFELAAIPALFMVLAGLPVVLLLTLSMKDPQHD